MRRGSPDRPTGGELGAVGRARRFELDAGEELWRVEANDEPLVGRLLDRGADAVGGFVDGGIDDEGPWLVRGPATPSLATWMKSAEPSWRESVRVVAALADVCGRCEGDAVFAGPLTPVTVSMALPDRPVLRADALVWSLLGADAEDPAGASRSTRWMPPEQASGAPWNNAANRYVLGLVLYRLLAGEHPFAGGGLRRGLEERASRGAPPMSADVARALPPGLHSYCLRMLEPVAADRPSSAAAIAARLRSFLEDPLAEPAPVTRRSVSTSDDPPAPEPRADDRAAPPSAVSRRSARKHSLLPWLAVAVGSLGAVAVLARTEPPTPKTPPTPRAPLSSPASSVDDCASCHPRQAAEWHRSVMAYSVRSPLFQGLEMLIEEQVGRDADCPGGAGILRRADPRTACVDRTSGLSITGSGGEHWCVNCHGAGENLARSVPAWDGRTGLSTSRRPLRDVLEPEAMEGISCAVCHQTHGPVRPGNLVRGLYEGNPFWTSTRTGERFSMRPEDARGTPGIANSGYFLDPAELLPGLREGAELVGGGVHARPTDEARDYLASSRFCGACHDVRLFGTDVLGVRQGEHFKRLRDAFSEWERWAATERRAGRKPASCQDCHMSTYPGVCVRGAEGPDGESTAAARACPPGTRFEPAPPGVFAAGPAALGRKPRDRVVTHYFSGVDVPLSREFPDSMIDEPSLDVHGIPLGARQRRDLLLARTFRLEVDEPRVLGSTLEIPVVVENVGAGHRVPAGFSQEREFWVHLRVTDGRGDLVYEVGRVDRGDEDLHDKVFVRVNVDDALRDGIGRPLGLFGADVADGPDVPRWSPPPELGGTRFRGRGLVNFQNGFLRCVVCIGTIDSRGHCQPLPGQERARADRYADGDYDPDTGECRSNLRGRNALFETYFPVGSLDATRGAVRGPDAIVNTRSVPPGVPIRYTYELDRRARSGPFRVEARLLFRAFPPFLVRAFADYETRQAARGLRPSGPLVTRDALDRLEVVEIARVDRVLE